ncbi:MAG: DUF935 domain-containing protein [Gammaproteobacteria bacterium]|nr:DUF935 domain-containing protein [Gammaproteobacteria bacterium]
MKEIDPKSEKGKKALAEETAGASLTGVRRAWNEDSIATGLNPSRLASVLSNANGGDAYDYLTLAEEMEEREPHYGSVIRTRKLAIEGLEKNIEAAGDDDKSQQIAESVRELIECPEFDNLLSALTDGLGKGYAAVEIIWDKKSFTPINYIWRDPRYFAFARDDAYTLHIRGEDNQAGDTLPPYKFITHIPKLKAGVPIRGGLARMAALSYMCKTYALTDWMAFCEVFGMPIRVGKYGNGASDVDKSVLKRAVANIGTDAAAIIPESMQLEFIQATNAKGGESLFENLADWLDRQVSKAVLGQTMTSDDGSSQAQAKVHNEVRLDLLKADAKQLAATINEQLIRPFVDFNFGVQKVYPKFVLYVPEPEDIAGLVDGVAKLVPLGLKVPQSFLRDKLGIPDPQEDEELLGRPTVKQPNSGEELSEIQPELNTRQETKNDDTDDDYDQFVNATTMAINELVEQLQSAHSFDEIKTLINNAELNTSDIADALALAGLKAFADGV